MLHRGLRTWRIASSDPGARLDAPAFDGTIESTGDVKVRAILAPTKRVLTLAAFDAAPVAEVA